MAKKTSILYVIIPIVYVGVIGVLVYLQFTGSRPFSEDIGSLRIAGHETTVPFAKHQKVKDAEIHYEGLVFSFTGERPARFENGSGRTSKLKIETYDSFPGGLELVFAGGLRLDFELEGSLGNSLAARARIPEAGTVLLPFDASQVSVRKGRHVPVLTFVHRQRSYHLTLPPGGRIDHGNGYVELPVSAAGASEEMRITEAEPGMADPFLYWFSQAGAMVGEETYRRELTLYLDAAYRGWNTERYVMGEGVWTMRGGSPGLPEELGVSWIAESLRRGDYQKARAFVSAAMDIRISRSAGEELRYLASPYVGRLTRFKDIYLDRLPERTARVQRLIRERDPAVFRMDDLIVTILGAGMISQIDELVSRVVMSVDTDSQDMETSLGMLETYLQVHALYQEAAGYFDRFRSIVEDRVLPQVRMVSGSPFLADESERELLDCLRTVQAGSCLRELGRREDNPALQSLGRGLILSVLELADEWGFVPRRIRSSGDGFEHASGEYVAPEEIYRRIVSWPYLPKERPLFPKAEPGVWIWTAGEIRDVVIRDGVTAFTFAFPQGMPHYILIQGLEPFQELTLKGKPVTPSPGYQTSGDGWYYDGSTQSLLIKLTQSQPEERIEIFYR